MSEFSHKTTHCTLHTHGPIKSSPRKLYTDQCTLNTPHWIMYAIHCALQTGTLQTIHCTLYTEHCILYTAHFKIYTAHWLTAYWTLNTEQWTLNTEHWKLNIAYIEVWANAVKSGFTYLKFLLFWKYPFLEKMVQEIWQNKGHIYI